VKSGVANYRKKNPNKKWGGRKSNLNPETAVEILTLNKEGVGIRKLSKQFSVSTNTIYKVIKEEIPFAA
jgi:DNA invertase Pin-like site-specific DNA recombinase